MIYLVNNMKKETIKKLAKRRKRVANAIRKKSKDSIRKARNEQDCLYVVRHGKSQVFKIGYGNPKKRIASMQVGNPVLLSLYLYVKLGELCRHFEKFFHKRYKKYRITGEWFFFPNEVLPIIKQDFEELNCGRIPQIKVPQTVTVNEEFKVGLLEGFFRDKCL